MPPAALTGGVGGQSCVCKRCDFSQKPNMGTKSGA